MTRDEMINELGKSIKDNEKSHNPTGAGNKELEGELEKEQREKEIVQIARQREKVRSKLKELGEEKKKLDQELRPFVLDNMTGKDDKGNPFWKKEGEVRIKLTPNIRYSVPRDKFVEKVGPKAALPFMNPDRSAIKKAIDVPGALEDFSEQDLEEIQETDEYPEKVKVELLS